MRFPYGSLGSIPSQGVLSFWHWWQKANRKKVKLFLSNYAMRKAFTKPYVFWLIGIFILYLLLNVALSGFYRTIPLITLYFKTVNWIKLGVSLILTLAIAFLVSLNAVYTYIKYKERKDCKRGATLAGASAIGGIILGVCPLCVVGVFPLILGLVGISFTFASLPFQGLEIQLIVVLLLLLSLNLLNKQKRNL